MSTGGEQEGDRLGKETGQDECASRQEKEPGRRAGRTWNSHAEKMSKGDEEDRK